MGQESWDGVSDRDLNPLSCDGRHFGGERAQDGVVGLKEEERKRKKEDELKTSSACFRSQMREGLHTDEFLSPMIVEMGKSGSGRGV